MTRMTGYQVFECPNCKKEHLVEAYGSINPSGLMPDPKVFEPIRTCASCGEMFDRRVAKFVGWLNKNTEPNSEDIEKYSIPHFLRK